jgi:hypothetical protein
LLCHVALQVLLGSTSQLDKGYSYSFLWPWLGSGLLTSKGKVIEPLPAIVTKVNETNSSTVINVIEKHSATVNRLTQTYSATVSKVIEKHSANSQ